MEPVLAVAVVELVELVVVVVEEEEEEAMMSTEFVQVVSSVQGVCFADKLSDFWVAASLPPSVVEGETSPLSLLSFFRRSEYHLRTYCVNKILDLCNIYIFFYYHCFSCAFHGDLMQCIHEAQFHPRNRNWWEICKHSTTVTPPPKLCFLACPLGLRLGLKTNLDKLPVFSKPTNGEEIIQ